MNVLANSELHMEWISFHAYWTKPLHAITSVNLNLYWDDLPSSFPSPLETEIGTGWAREMRSFECYKISRVSLAFEKAMAPHSSPLAWRIPWMEKPGGLQSTGSLGVGHDWSDLAAADNPLQYSCLENPMDGGAWWAAVSGVAQSRTRLKRLSSSSSSSTGL